MSDTTINQHKSNDPKIGFCPMFNQSPRGRTTAKGRLAWRVEIIGWVDSGYLTVTSWHVRLHIPNVGFEPRQAGKKMATKVQHLGAVNGKLAMP